MALHVPQPDHLSPEAYLEQERNAPTKSEYWGGVVVAMSGASRNHNRILVNLLRHIANQLDGTPCEVMGSDMRILVPACRAYFYPDVVLTCAEPVFQDEEQDTILNPTVLIEILSKSTEKLDRERKFDCYRLLPTLTTYVLVSQEQARIEVYQRDGEEWRFMPLLGRDQSLTLPMLTSPLSFESIYARVKFGEEE